MKAKRILIFLLFIVIQNIVSQNPVNIYNKDKVTVLKYFMKETIGGGKLDFEMKMKDDKSPFYLIDKVMYNRKDFSILLWAQAIKKTQKFSKKESVNLWQEIKKRKLTKPEKKAFNKGFKMILK